MRAVGALAAALLAMLALLLTTIAPTASAQSGTSEECGFLDGFRVLRDQIGPAIVGDCLEHSRPVEGGVEQHTTGGLLVWNQALNLVSFTDGHQTWIAGPNGIQIRPNAERFAWEEEALRAAEAEAAERAKATRSPTLHELAMIYVERVRGNNQVSLERIYVTAYFHAQRRVRDLLSGAHTTAVGSVRAATHHVRDWVATSRQQALRNTP